MPDPRTALWAASLAAALGLGCRPGPDAAPEAARIADAAPVAPDARPADAPTPPAAPDARPADPSPPPASTPPGATPAGCPPGTEPLADGCVHRLAPGAQPTAPGFYLDLPTDPPSPARAARLAALDAPDAHRTAAMAEQRTQAHPSINRVPGAMPRDLVQIIEVAGQPMLYDPCDGGPLSVAFSRGLVAVHAVETSAASLRYVEAIAGGWRLAVVRPGEAGQQRETWHLRASDLGPLRAWTLEEADGHRQPRLVRPADAAKLPLLINHCPDERRPEWAAPTP